jgi:septum formation protein
MLQDLLTKNNKTLILGSQSPRRKELLQQMGVNFEVRPADIDESFDENMSPDKVAVFLAESKAKHLLKSAKENEIILTSDTIVVLDKEIINKPETTEEAISMLQKLSGRTHTVISGYCLADTEQILSGFDTSQVTFKPLTADEINHYVTHYHPLDKAGAYGIQEWIGYIGIEKINGSFFTVMGLPTHKVYEVLKRSLNPSIGMG